jgi:hypothetical protein
MEAVVEALYGLAESVAGKNAGKFFPLGGHPLSSLSSSATGAV